MLTEEKKARLLQDARLQEYAEQLGLGFDEDVIEVVFNSWKAAQAQTFGVTLESAKTFLRVENNAEYVLISGLINAAESFVLRMTGRDCIDSYDLQAAVMLVLCGLYENRNSHEEARKVVLNPVLQMILQSARVDDACI